MKKNVKQGLIATITGAIINLILGVLKICIGVVTNSVSIFFDGVNSFLDIFGSSFGAIGIGVSSLKPNEDYPNGFGRMEYIMTFVISTITLIMGGMFIYYSVERFMYPLPVQFGWIYFGLLALSLVIKIIQTIWFYILNKKSNSDITKALFVDCLLDIGITGSILMCYGLSVVVNNVIDSYIGIIVGVIILISAIKMVKNSVINMLGYNTERHISEYTEKLINDGIFTKIRWAKINDLGKINKEILVKGDLAQNSEDKMKQFEETENMKIYVIKE